MVEAKELEHSVRRCPETPPEFSGHEPVTIQPWLALWIFPANRTPTWQSRRRSPGARGPANPKESQRLDDLCLPALAPAASVLRPMSAVPAAGSLPPRLDNRRSPAPRQSQGDERRREQNPCRRFRREACQTALLPAHARTAH